jgi:hypothetical protein
MRTATAPAVARPRGPRPVYWKPSIPTRVMRERAFAKRELERERVLKATPGPTLGQWLKAKLSRRTS